MVEVEGPTVEGPTAEGSTAGASVPTGVGIGEPPTDPRLERVDPLPRTAVEADVERPRWTDNHCHLPDDPEDLAVVFIAANEAGVGRLIDVGTDHGSSERAWRRARMHDDVWATAGVHPHDAKGVVAASGSIELGPIRELLGKPKVVAVGECGLDYHYDHSPRDQQRAVFAAQIALAHELDLALVIHTRDAWDDTFAILEAEGVPERTVFHCFTGGPDEARRGLDLGISLSFSGIVTYKSAPELREAAALCPLDRLLVETDAPYLTPEPHRGTRNRPALVPLVGAKIAEVKDVPVEAVAAATWGNAATLYRLD